MNNNCRTQTACKERSATVHDNNLEPHESNRSNKLWACTSYRLCFWVTSFLNRAKNNTERMAKGAIPKFIDRGQFFKNKKNTTKSFPKCKISPTQITKNNLDRKKYKALIN